MTCVWLRGDLSALVRYDRIDLAALSIDRRPGRGVELHRPMTATALAPSPASGDAVVPALAYQPALDGVRAFAVIAVVAFHAGATWAPGGYLGVSVFFTLSGYLITTVLLDERVATGRVDLPRFVSRRIRRLAPASLLTLGVVTVLAILGIGAVAAGEAGHIRWASAHLANWDQLWTGNTYADAVTGAADQSPVLHYWSLAIEEQFYLVWPAVVVGAFILLRRARCVRWFVAVPALLLVVSWALVGFLASRGEAEAVYLNSASRGAEILTGCLVAALLHLRPSVGTRGATLAPMCAAVIVVAVVVTGTSNEAWPYRGGLPIFALVSAGLILGLRHRTRFSQAVGSGPLVWVGRRSYGIYLYHWPIFVLVPLESAGIVPHALRLAAVFVLAAVSYRWIEQPVRYHATRASVTIAAAVAGACVIIGATFLIDEGPVAITAVDEIDVDDRAAVGISDSATVPMAAPRSDDPDTNQAPAVPAASSAPSESSTVTEPVETETPDRIVVVGDSTAVALSSGLVDWAEQSGGGVQVGIAAHGACGLVRDGTFVRNRSLDLDILNAALALDCPPIFDDELPELLRTAPIDLVVVIVSLADTWERSWDDGATFTVPTDPRHGARVRSDYESFVNDVTTLGARKVVFVRPPVAYRADDLDEPEAAWSNGAAQVVDGIAADLATQRKDVQVLDLRALLEEAGMAEDLSLRPDGVHWTAEASTELAETLLGPALLEIVDD